MRTLLILDDLMAEADDSIANVFTKISHHRNVSVIFLTQNLFHKNKHMRTISLNAHYLVLFKNPRDVEQFATLARQMYAKNWQFAVEAFRDATRLHITGVDLRYDGATCGKNQHGDRLIARPLLHT